jgi:hypothetical protein
MCGIGGCAIAVFDTVGNTLWDELKLKEFEWVTDIGVGDIGVDRVIDVSEVCGVCSADCAKMRWISS